MKRILCALLSALLLLTLTACGGKKPAEDRLNIQTLYTRSLGQDQSARRRGIRAKSLASLTWQRAGAGTPEKRDSK